jgi:hypothetical protein
LFKPDFEHVNFLHFGIHALGGDVGEFKALYQIAVLILLFLIDVDFVVHVVEQFILVIIIGEKELLGHPLVLHLLMSLFFQTYPGD